MPAPAGRVVCVTAAILDANPPNGFAPLTTPTQLPFENARLHRSRPSRLAVIATLVALAVALIALALAPRAEAAQVERVQIPAWLARGGERLPVNAGMPLESGDRLRTGAGGRLLLRLAEGSLVKLGPDAELVLEALKPPASEGGLFEGLLDVVKGAFRFTTTLLSKARRRRVDVRIANVTAGIRGTDVWGKAAADRDIVCLIEGEISVQRSGDSPVTLSDPLTFYVAPKNQAPLPVRPVDPDQLQRWAEETDIAENAPALGTDGAWSVHLASLSTRVRAEQSRTRLRGLGYPVNVASAQIGGATYFRISLSGFTSWQGAVAFKDGAAARLGFPTAWVAEQ